MDAKAYLWSEIPQDKPIPLLARRLLKGENALVAEVRLEKGCVVATHSHASEQIAIMLSGKARWVIGADGSPNQREVLMTGGAVMVLPPNVPHGLTVLEDSVIIDVLSPVGPMGVDSMKKG